MFKSIYYGLAVLVLHLIALLAAFLSKVQGSAWGEDVIRFA